MVAIKADTQTLLDQPTENLLIKGLKSIPSEQDALQRLLYLPAVPVDISSIPLHVRLYRLMEVRDLHIPSPVERQLLQTVDLMVRSGYSYRDPRKASTWASIGGEGELMGIRLPKATASAVEGLSGVGKTEACLRSLHSLGPQVVRHESFPHLVGGLNQVVWLSVEVPASGRAIDLARALMLAWDEATGGNRFTTSLERARNDGMRSLEEFRQVAKSGFLGVLHLDEIQNLFKARPLKERQRRANVDRADLSIVEDQVLRWFLSLTNSGQIPILVSGTPDGIGALTKRFSTAQRINTAGYFKFDRFTSSHESQYRKFFLKSLERYQYVDKPIAVDDHLAEHLLALTAGVPRILIALWIAAHRISFERRRGVDLTLQDFETASHTLLAPLAPAIEAIQEGNPTKMNRYEDLITDDTSFWSEFWSTAQPNVCS
ncbi:AAA family ATPase [Hydrogenophaga sp. 5NK40-0174]|uniref:AAA family ATPase n=1 Tax=Hydrogenophaga sp. 5NK40-0174 TaxID=3127649 RepID=UPI00310A72AC